MIINRWCMAIFGFPLHILHCMHYPYWCTLVWADLYKPHIPTVSCTIGLGSLRYLVIYFDRHVPQTATAISDEGALGSVSGGGLLEEI